MFEHLPYHAPLTLHNNYWCERCCALKNDYVHSNYHFDNNSELVSVLNGHSMSSWDWISGFELTSNFNPIQILQNEWIWNFSSSSLQKSGQKQEFSAQNQLFQSKSGQQSQPFYFKTAHFGQRRLVFWHFFYFKLKFTLCFVVKQEVKTRSFKFTHFAILKFDVSSKPKIQFWEESWMAIQYTDLSFSCSIFYLVVCMDCFNKNYYTTKHKEIIKSLWNWVLEFFIFYFYYYFYFFYFCIFVFLYFLFFNFLIF